MRPGPGAPFPAQRPLERHRSRLQRHPAEARGACAFQAMLQPCEATICHFGRGLGGLILVRPKNTNNARGERRYQYRVAYRYKRVRAHSLRPLPATSCLQVTTPRPATEPAPAPLPSPLPVVPQLFPKPGDPRWPPQRPFVAIALDQVGHGTA